MQKENSDHRRDVEGRRARGIVMRIFITRGFGFLRGEDQQDRFFHIDDVRGRWEDLRVGDVVDFIPTDSGGGGNRLRAVDVVVTSEHLLGPDELSGDQRSRRRLPIRTITAGGGLR
jgi:cold shock CspA family protein